MARHTRPPRHPLQQLGAFLPALLLSLLSMSTGASEGNSQHQQSSVEELRLPAAQQAMPGILLPLQAQVAASQQAWLQAVDFNSLRQRVRSHGDQLWQAAKAVVAGKAGYDDRGLYWSRLQLSQFLRQQTFSFAITAQQRSALLEALEHSSRGHLDLAYQQMSQASTNKRILLTGFDPFLLDKNISQSNPSGVLALLLDGQVIKQGDNSAEINTLMFPVRYADFDAGEVEAALAPFFALNSVDMIITVSMGRETFDLEHFPGRRRSASAPDNLNLFAGGNDTNPVIPSLLNKPLPGPEFVQSSLPITIMQTASGAFEINDRRLVTTLEKTFSADNLEQLRWATAVRGGGGGYLSNEISYRSIRLRNQLGSTIATGHLHTPRMPVYDKAMLEKIASQVTTMLRLALPAI
jgi:pyrrolidone-carboxylate peptidase